MTGTVECRYYGRDFSAEEMALLRAADRRPSAAEPPRPVEGVLPAHPLAQARWRAQGHDGQGDHAGHAQGRPDRAAGAEVAAEPAKADRLRTGNRAAAVPGAGYPRRGPSARPADRRSRHPGGQALERVRRPLPLSRLQQPWSAPRCATPSTTERAGRSPCSASPPPRGSSPRATPSSDGRRNCARRTYPSSSTTRGSSSCPGSRSPTSARTSSP